MFDYFYGLTLINAKILDKPEFFVILDCRHKQRTSKNKIKQLYITKIQLIWEPRNFKTT